jgi:membrane-associated protease RseP (regulator of RpoE activity)
MDLNAFITGIIQYKYVILFYLLVILILYLNRKKFEVHGIICLYRTQIGIKFMDAVANNYRELIKLLGYCSIGIAYIGLLVVSALLLKVAYDLTLEKPGATGVSPVIPGLPIAGTGLVFPLVIGWLSLFIIIVIHEFSHGVVARVHSLEIKNTGILFLGPILGAFVEPDEKKMAKRPDIEQYSILSAGPIANVVLAIVALLLLGFVVSPTYMSITEKIGVMVSPINDTPAYFSGMKQGTIITGVDNLQINDYNSFSGATALLKPNQTVIVNTTNGTYTIITAIHPNNATRGYIGISPTKSVSISKKGFEIIWPVLDWIRELLFWLYFLSINVGLINLYPMFITDGARIVKVTVDKLVKDEKKAFKIWKNINMAALFLLLAIIFLPMVQWLFKIVF